MSDPFQLNRLIRDVVSPDLRRLDERFGDGVVAIAEGGYCSVRKGDPEAPATPGFFVPPDVYVASGDHVWYFDSGGFKVIVKNLNRAAESGTTFAPTIYAHSGDWGTGGGVGAYSQQIGRWWRTGNRVEFYMAVTVDITVGAGATGTLRMTELPFTVHNDGGHIPLAGVLQGWTKAGYTQISPRGSPSSKDVSYVASGSGQPLAAVNIADLATGTLIARVSGSYYTTDPR